MSSYDCRLLYFKAASIRRYVYTPIHNHNIEFQGTMPNTISVIVQCVCVCVCVCICMYVRSMYVCMYVERFTNDTSPLHLLAVYNGLSMAAP